MKPRCLKCGEPWKGDTGKAPCAAGGQCEIEGLRPRPRPRLCRAYCNSLRACGVALALCPHCDACETAIQFWERVLTSSSRRPGE